MLEQYVPILEQMLKALEQIRDNKEDALNIAKQFASEMLLDGNQKARAIATEVKNLNKKSLENCRSQGFGILFLYGQIQKVINGQINEVTTLYVNNSVNQIGGEGDARLCALPRACTRAFASCEISYRWP